MRKIFWNLPRSVFLETTRSQWENRQGEEGPGCGRLEIRYVHRLSLSSSSNNQSCWDGIWNMRLRQKLATCKLRLCSPREPLHHMLSRMELLAQHNR